MVSSLTAVFISQEKNSILNTNIKGNNVVVADIQMRTLKAEEGKVPCEWYLHMS